MPFLFLKPVNRKVADRAGRKAWPVFFLLLTGLVGLQPGRAFTVIKNVNSGVPPVEKIVLFDKTQTANRPALSGSDDATASLGPDGAIESQITGNGPVNIQIKWKPAGDLAATFDATSYNFLLLTCRLEGNLQKTGPDGKPHDVPRGDNLYFAATLIDTNDQRVDLANLADANDGKTPAQTVTLAIPMILFTKGTFGDPHHIKAVGFFWDKTHPDINRNFHLVVDKISLAD